jgi:hypothetical protein
MLSVAPVRRWLSLLRDPLKRRYITAFDGHCCSCPAWWVCRTAPREWHASLPGAEETCPLSADRPNREALEQAPLTYRYIPARPASCCGAMAYPAARSRHGKRPIRAERASCERHFSTGGNDRDCRASGRPAGSEPSPWVRRSARLRMPSPRPSPGSRGVKDRAGQPPHRVRLLPLRIGVTAY